MQERDLKIELTTAPAPEDERLVREGLREHNEQHLPSGSDVSFAAFLRGADGAVLGGVLARAGRGWLHVGELWVDARVRGQGHGTRLMEAAEEQGRRLGCHSAYLSTYDYQARPFYERRGYAVFGTLENFPGAHAKYYMRKSLAG